MALRVGIEAGKQVILDGKISNAAGLVGAAAAGGAFKDMGASGSAQQAAGNFASNNSATFGAGLALLESKVRGQGNNAMQWVALATAAAFDSGALSAGGDSPAKSNPASRATSPQYFTSGGEMNWRVVAAQAIGTAIVSNRMGGEAAIGYFGNAVAEFAVQAGGRAMDERVAARASAAASQAGYDQAVEAFSNPASVDRSGDVLLAAGPGYSGMGGTGGKSQREQNIERMMRMANEPEAMGSTSAFRVEINGTSTTTSADVPRNAGSSSASMFPNSQVTGSGFTSDGRPYYDWDSGATTIGIPPRPESDGSPVKLPDTGLAGLGFGMNAVQGAPQWIDAVGDSRIRLDYYNARVIGLPDIYRLGPDATIDQLRANAEVASGERNAALDETRARISEQGLDWSRDLKRSGLPFDQVERMYIDKLGADPKNPGPEVYREIIEASGRSNTTVTNTAKTLVGIEKGVNMVAKPLMVVSAGLDGYSLGTEINQSINTGNWQNTGRESARIAGAWTGAWAGAETGALSGAVVGAWTGPLAPLAVPAFTLLGGLGGGVVGYWKGGQVGQNIYNLANGNRR